MKWLNWQDACKFLSGVAFADSLMNGYLFLCRKSIPFMSYVIMDDSLGQKAALLLGLFAALFYLGFRSPERRNVVETTQADIVTLTNPSEHVA
jgi:hypothetical protein